MICLPPSRRLCVMAMSAIYEIDAPIYVSLREGFQKPGPDPCHWGLALSIITL